MRRAVDGGFAPGAHMPKHLEWELETLSSMVRDMAAAVEGAVERATRALWDRDAGLAEQVLAGEQAIDRQDNAIEDECLKVLALHQPVAIDLRRVTAIMRVNSDLERMADLAANIAAEAVRLARLPPVAVPPQFRHMTDLTTGMVRQSLDAFARLDTGLARRVCRLDDEVDRDNADIITELTRVMRVSPESVEPALSLFSAARDLERIADHATNIAEDAIYLAEGKIVRHNPEASRGTATE
jgi:phosphate transport system protein